MAKATRHIQHNEEHYVAKMNFRSEKILQNQISRLNKEKLLQVKSLNAQMRNYERKLQKISDRALEVEQLSRNGLDLSQRLPTREHFSKLSSDATRQRHMTTGVGYSYIDQLLGVSKPLVNRPLRWGINPSLPSLQQQSSKPITLVADAATSQTFLTEIKGQPIYLRPREAVYIKRQKPTTLVLPPIALNKMRRETQQQKLDADDSLADKASRKFRELENKNDGVINQGPISQLSPIPESEIEEARQIPKVENEADKTGAEMRESAEHTEEKPTILEPSSITEKPGNVSENSEPSLDKKVRTTSSSPLRGHFTTEYEFPTHGVERFTRSSEMLNIEAGDLQTEQRQKENEPSSFRYQLHARRFSL